VTRTTDERDAHDERVFKALGDPNRRALLDSLFAADGQPLGVLCDTLPDLSRFGVMKHLAVLHEAGLVVTCRDGRTKLHYLNPVPIQQIHSRWISKYAGRTTTALVDLEARVEQDDRSARSSRISSRTPTGGSDGRAASRP
jgi:DNA-binding transcriptional ArsR family regulator